MKLFLLLVVAFFLFASSHVFALDLFDIKLEQSNRAELRSAVEGAGAIIVRRGGKLNAFDRYTSKALLNGSDEIYLGFDKQTNEFAFLEYRIPGMGNAAMLKKMEAKYGKAKTIRGEFISDTIYQWQVDGLLLSLYHEWDAGVSRLIYANEKRLIELQKISGKNIKKLAINY